MSSNKFKVGDKVVIVKNMHIWSKGRFPESSVLTVVEDSEFTDSYVDRDELTIELTGVNGSPNDFELVDAPFGGFVSGTKTGLIGEAGCETVMPITLEQTVRAEPARVPLGGFHNGAVLNLPDNIERTLLEGYKEAITKSHEGRDTNKLGTYRPNLEDRKVGKVRVELVDKGFPNALWEVARLMTKAQEVKGYADHDWKNLPNWQESFSAAASRHRMKHNKGEFFDDEFDDFEILHKVNEAFNVLAELELMIVNRTHG